MSTLYLNHQPTTPKGPGLNQNWSVDWATIVSFPEPNSAGWLSSPVKQWCVPPGDPEHVGNLPSVTRPYTNCAPSSSRKSTTEDEVMMPA